MQTWLCVEALKAGFYGYISDNCCFIVYLKVPPPKIDFTLPSPTVGMPLGHPPDCPWDARLILEEQQDKKKQDKKKIRDSGNALKNQQERSDFLLRAVPVSMEATVGMNVAEEEKGELPNWLAFDRFIAGNGHISIDFSKRN